MVVQLNDRAEQAFAVGRDAPATGAWDLRQEAAHMKTFQEAGHGMGLALLR